MSSKNLSKCLGRAYRAQAKFLDELLKPYDLWHGQLFLLKHLLAGDIKCHKELCRNRLIDKAAVSRAVNKLVDSGYLQKEKDPQDKRKSVLLPTEKSLKFALILDDLLNLFQDLALQGFSAEEQEKFLEFLERFSINLSQGVQDAE